MINVLNLPIYVVGGGVASAWEAFAPTIFEEVKRRSFVYRPACQFGLCLARPPGGVKPALEVDTNSPRFVNRGL